MGAEEPDACPVLRGPVPYPCQGDLQGIRPRPCSPPVAPPWGDRIGGGGGQGIALTGGWGGGLSPQHSGLDSTPKAFPYPNPSPNRISSRR